MDRSAPVGFLLGIVFISSAIFLEGRLENFYNFPSILIVVGGITSSLITSYSIEDCLEGIRAIKIVFSKTNKDISHYILELEDLSLISRKEGLLALEDRMAGIDDRFLKKGIMMIVDGTDYALVRDILQNDLLLIKERHSKPQKFWQTVADLGPAWGMIGTLIGLINMLIGLSEPTTLGPSMAMALITTFYGTIIANFFALPIANNLRKKTAEEILLREMIMEGILSIQAGENPIIIREKLRTYLVPSYRAFLERTESIEI
ncbi:flagellar motor protein MotP [Candidatus Epulonipiscium fishelsonii]|uniref:Flagellar motor protein MotP n=1 Tax=Candidatus Epulonipiscium fishelsonii TaxID=77094 RepID=A0ACC8XIU0_9FIRM|nr:flagellar motor protein MotP [Epulopiscium sp. SCG-D08WGA-EpuloA1]OON96730.1 MAG: flagellar motor protein MotP [Epulopiscium sp. AS2M-Bin002]